MTNGAAEPGDNPPPPGGPGPGERADLEPDPAWLGAGDQDATGGQDQSPRPTGAHDRSGAGDPYHGRGQTGPGDEDQGQGPAGTRDPSGAGDQGPHPVRDGERDGLADSPAGGSPGGSAAGPGDPAEGDAHVSAGGHLHGSGAGPEGQSDVPADGHPHGSGAGPVDGRPGGSADGYLHGSAGGPASQPSEDQHPQAQLPQAQHPQGQLPQGQHPQGQHPQGQHPQDQHPQGQPPWRSRVSDGGGRSEDSGRVVRQHVAALFGVVGVLVVLGVGAGLLWHLVAPRTEYVFRDGTGVFTEPVPTAPIAADGWFALIALVAGVLSGSLTQAFLHRRLVGAVIGLALGTVAASLVAWQVGHWFGNAEFQEAVKGVADGTKLLAPLDVRARGVLTLWPLAAMLTIFLGTFIDEVQRRLSRTREPAGPPPPRELPPIREAGNHTSSYPYAGPAGEQGSTAP